MKKEIAELIEVSRYYGNDNEYVIAGGGNTSYKDDKHIWVKASGSKLGTIEEEGFAMLYRDKLKVISEKTYSNDAEEREQQVKDDLYKARVFPEKNQRPSVETNLHDVIGYSFVVHLHPTLVNALTCGKNSRNITLELFGEDALYIPYIDPGYTLFKEIEQEVITFRAKHGFDPKIIILENHGIFVSSNKVEEIKEIYTSVIDKIKSKINDIITPEELPVDSIITSVIPAIRMILSNDVPKIVKIRNNSLIAKFIENEQEFRNVAHPFTPDNIVYCKSKYMYFEKYTSPENLLELFKSSLDRFKKEYGYDPKVLLIKDVGLIAIEESNKASETVLDVFEDMMKISFYSNSFGGPRFMTMEQIAFIDNWEVENYRRAAAKKGAKNGRVTNKIVAVTGAARGFGAGIAEKMFRQGANVIVTDINEQEGANLVLRLNSESDKNNKAVFIKSDVSSPESVKNMVFECVKEFGGIDVFISNAGILKAGSLDEMEPEAFELMTKVNYSAYFLCAKYVSPVMKLQHEYNDGYYMDIIQINSKSGLKGSNKNFAYAGGKFGGIGLTQSFALELMPYNIKVNSICPGNFFDGPLWADPETGLFIQYLKAGKVPGAKTIEDVKKHYENMVPAKRGCTVEDVMKALLYVIDQEYETGQAVPVTGGQNMLN